MFDFDCSRLSVDSIDLNIWNKFVETIFRLICIKNGGEIRLDWSFTPVEYNEGHGVCIGFCTESSTSPSSIAGFRKGVADHQDKRVQWEQGIEELILERVVFRILVEKLLSSLREIDKVVETKVQIIESLDITIQIVSYKIYEATHEFKVKIGEMKDERNRLLVSIENRSELSLILHDLDQKILELEKELDSKIKSYNQEKIVRLFIYFWQSTEWEFKTGTPTTSWTYYFSTGRRHRYNAR